ncbi:MAG TPA: VCBS repeat-containing protein [Candidatus Brocadiia bacterium]|nr:VCBS repeat-containing protein [Candidatus Brocadiia bacterium]
MHKPVRHKCLMILLVVIAVFLASAHEGSGYELVRYRNPGLVVDLGVGLWAQPLPMDYDGDGDMDLVVATTNKPSSGVYFFENTEGKVKFPVFKPAIRIGEAKANCQAFELDGQIVVTTPGRVYRDFRKRRLDGGEPISYKKEFHAGRSDHWRICDFDGDGVNDLVIGASDWREYGWDNAFDAGGKWTRGPIHGFVYFVKNIGTNADPKYAPAVQLQAGDAPMDVFGMPSPSLADWDGDGDLDIICGEFLDKLTWFENIGSRTEPKYATGRHLKYEGNTITMDLEMIISIAVDWDGDGDQDLVVGQEDGRVALMENTGGFMHGMPSFLTPKFFKQQADMLKVGALSTPYSFDWDGDGDEDIICGDTAGYISFVENLDGGCPPKWAEPKYLEAGGRTIRIQAGYNGSIQGPAEAKWGYTVVCVADWDHDGLPDVMANSIWGEVIWHRNIGTRKQPALAPALAVEVEWESKPPKPMWNWWNPKGRQLVTQWRTCPYITDLNGDGLNDLIILDHEGYPAFFERKKDNSGLKLLPGKRIFMAQDGQPLRLNPLMAGKSGRRQWAMTDWDGDGKKDLIIDGKPTMDLMRNTAQKDGEYVFAGPTAIDPQVLAGHTPRPTIVDWNRDGVPDLLIGAEDGFFYYLENSRKAQGAGQGQQK